MDARALSRRPLTRAALVVLTALALCGALVAAGCGATGARATSTSTRAASGSSGSSGSGGSARTAASRTQTVSVTGATMGKPIPSGFVGLSIEERALEQFAGTNPAALDPVFLHLVQDIAPNQSPVLRFAGDSTDWTWWPVPHMAQPGGVKYSLTPTYMSVAKALAQDLHAKLILGVNLEADSKAIAVAEAGAMMSRIGRSNIEAFELGNEPELYGTFGWYRSPITHQLVPGRPRDYSVADFESDFSRFSGYLKGDPLAGPSMGGPEWLQSLGSFVSSEHRLSLVTVHAYPLKHCSKSTVVTSAQLLANSSSQGLAQRVAPWVALSAAHHLPLRVDEINGISCGGTRGVSDTFTSALWILDTLFEMAKVGVAGVNVHGVPNTINELLGPSESGGKWSVRVHPQYYGMIMFAQAAPAGSHLLRLSDKLPSGIKVWATRVSGHAGATHVVVINKNLSGTDTVHLKIPGSTGAAAEEELRAPSVHATSGVTLGGQTFGAATTTGVLGGTPSNLSVTPAGGTYTVAVPAASATMLTLP